MTTGRVSLCIVAFVCLVGFGVHANSHRTPAQSSDARATTGPTARPRLLSTYGTLPARFEANRGQTDRRVKFLYRGRGYTLFLTATEAILSFKPLQAQCGRASHGAHEQPPVPQSGKSAADRALAPVRMSLVGANPAPEVTGLDRLPGIVNYFIGNDPKKSHTNISTYAMVRYKNVYPGIDLVYHSNHGQLKYDFAVAPGADFKAIRLRLDGGGKLKMDAKGNLVLAQTQGEVRFHKPYLYQVSHGQRHAVSGHYLLRSASQASFEVASYDKGRPLIIDPSLSYSTYLGSSHFDQGNGIAVDSMGNAYVTGFTRGTDTTFPIFPSGVYQTPNSGDTDAFVTKFNSAGVLAYSTYFGGSAADQATGIAVDTSGNAYVTGETFSSNFPTTAGAFKTAYGGNGDAFVAKLSSNGSSLLYSTYFGGSALDEARGIALDSSGDIYIAGKTFSTDFPTLSALQNANQGRQDAFVAEFSASGSLLFSTYLGGSGDDEANAIAVDSMKRAYVTGYTTSQGFPLSSNAAQGVCSTCFAQHDAFVTEIGTGGSALVYSTFLGGTDEDQGMGVAVDSNNPPNAYVTGFTSSTDFPTTSGAYDTTAPWGTSVFGSGAFVAKLSPNISAGSTLVYSTYLGGDKFSFGQAITVLSGNAYVTGVTSADNFPLKNALLSTFTFTNPETAIFVTELNSTASASIFSTYLGGGMYYTDTGRNEGTAIALNSSGTNTYVYITGRTKSTNFNPQNPYQSAYGGGDSDAFVTKIQLP